MQWLYSKTGVSNTWPAWRVYAARVIIKIPFPIIEITVLCGISELFTPLCGPQRHLCVIVRPTISFITKMWPANIVVFETPVLRHVLFDCTRASNVSHTYFVHSWQSLTIFPWNKLETCLNLSCFTIENGNAPSKSLGLI